MRSGCKTREKHKKPIRVGDEVTIEGGKTTLLVAKKLDVDENKFILNGVPDESFFGHQLRRTDDRN